MCHFIYFKIEWIKHSTEDINTTAVTNLNRKEFNIFKPTGYTVLRMQTLFSKTACKTPNKSAFHNSISYIYWKTLLLIGILQVRMLRQPLRVIMKIKNLAFGNIKAILEICGKGTNTFQIYSFNINSYRAIIGVN